VLTREIALEEIDTARFRERYRPNSLLFGLFVTS
jgi:hypothetical protein